MLKRLTTTTTLKLIGYVRERNYKGMTLESVVELGKWQDGDGQRILQ